jgi:hypothetical protein
MGKVVKRGRGRPPTGHNRPVLVRLNDTQLRIVKKLATEHQITRSEAIRRLLDEAIQARKKDD